MGLGTRVVSAGSYDWIRYQDLRYWVDFDFYQTLLVVPEVMTN